MACWWVVFEDRRRGRGAERGCHRYQWCQGWMMEGRGGRDGRGLRLLRGARVPGVSGVSA